MKYLVVFAAVIAAAVAQQVVSVNQDTLGNYDLKYVINGISRSERGNAFGEVAGGFAYLDPYGVLRRTEFTSGVNGYRAVGTDIPLPVVDTPEVAHAKAAHLSALHAARASLPPAPLEVSHPELYEPVFRVAAPLPAPIPTAVLPLPLQFGGVIPDTPEVAAARAEHFAAHAAARARLHL